MKKNVINFIVFMISAICFAVRTKLIYNTGYFCDEYNFSPADIYGGSLYLILDWAEWALLAVICVITFIGFIVFIIKSPKK